MMDKKYNMRRLLFAAAVMSLFLTGCSTEKPPKVIGEKPDSSQETQEASITQDENRSPDGGGIRNQVQAPERFQAEVKEEEMMVLADAPVTVPDVAQMSVKKSKVSNFTEEEYQQVKDTVTSQMKISWDDGSFQTEDDSPVLKTISEDGHDNLGIDYRISYRTGIGENSPSSSLIWVTRLNTEGRSSTRPGIIYDSDQEEAVSRSGKAEALEKKTAELLKAAGFEHYRQYRGMWRQSYYNLRGEEQSDMEYIITYTPVADGVSCTENVVNLFGTSYLYGPYIEVYYDEDGAFNQLKIIDKQEVEDGSQTESFLLPFEAVHELFIQYCRDYFREGGGADSNKPLTDTGLQPVVTVKNVKLEYAFLQKKGGPADEMELAPVWNFYGSITKGWKTDDYWTARQEPEGLILSIRADDGQILAD